MILTVVAADPAFRALGKSDAIVGAGFVTNKSDGAGSSATGLRVHGIEQQGP